MKFHAAMQHKWQCRKQFNKAIKIHLISSFENRAPLVPLQQIMNLWPSLRSGVLHRQEEEIASNPFHVNDHTQFVRDTEPRRTAQWDRVRGDRFMCWNIPCVHLMMYVRERFVVLNSMGNLLKRHCRQFCHFAWIQNENINSISIKRQWTNKTQKKKRGDCISNARKFTIFMTCAILSISISVRFARILTSHSNKSNESKDEMQKKTQNFIYESSEKPIPMIIYLRHLVFCTRFFFPFIQLNHLGFMMANRHNAPY